MRGREICWDEMVHAQDDLVQASFDRISELSRRYVETGRAAMARSIATAVADRPSEPNEAARTLTEEKLAAADQRMALAEARFVRQTGLVSRLSAAGRATDLAAELLEQLKLTLEVMRKSRRLLLFDIVDRRADAGKPPELPDQQHTFLEAVLQHLPAGILIVEAPTGRVLFRNRRLVEILAEPKHRDGRPNEDRNSLGFAPGGPLARAIEGGHAAVGEEVEFLRGDGTPGVAAVHAMAIRDAAGLIVAGVAVFQDVTERNAGDARVRHMAMHNSLTGLPNRALFHDRLAQALARARRAIAAGGGPGEAQQVAVMLLDLDGFKDVNDALGHETGDRLLRAVATCLGAVIRASDTLARLGGDEFALALPDLRRPADAAALADKLLASSRHPAP